MITLIAGSRSITNYDLLCRVIAESRYDITSILSGCADGVDTLGEKWGLMHDIPVSYFPAKWNDLSHPDAIIKVNLLDKPYDARAGFRRNQSMVDQCDQAIILHDLFSHGTWDTIKRLRAKKIPYVIGVVEKAQIKTITLHKEGCYEIGEALYPDNYENTLFI